jgi:hypothetical protein
MPFAEAWSPHLPALRDFLVSPGFAGAGIAFAAIVVLGAVLYASRRAARRLDKQLEQHDLERQDLRAEREREAAIARCWERLVWLVQTGGVDPAALEADEAILGLGPELALTLLEGLHRDAKDLGDDTLAAATRIYLTQYALVLGQQGGPLPDRVPGSNGHPGQITDDKNAATSAATTEHPATTEKPAAADKSAPAAAQTRQGK